MALTRALGVALLTMLVILGLAARSSWALRPSPTDSLTARLLTAAVVIALIFVAVLVVDVIGR